MKNRCFRFLALEALVILIILVMSQVYPYPIPGQAGVEERLKELSALHDYELVLKADLGSSLLFLLRIRGQYCEKLFDKSLLFDRYAEKPLVLLRPVDAGEEARFVAADSAQSHLYTVNDREELVLLKQSRNHSLTLAYALFTLTLILLGLNFGRGKGKKKPGNPSEGQAPG